MSIAMDSPAHSSDSDEFAAILDAELGNVSDASADPVDDEVSENEESDDGDLDMKRAKRRKGEWEDLGLADIPVPTSGGFSPKKNECLHPGAFGGLCYICAQSIDDESGVSFRYIHKNLRLANDEVTRLHDIDLKSLLNRKKLCLVIDLDHTLLNSAKLSDITAEEGYLTTEIDSFPDAFKSSLRRLERMPMMTKLRPFVHTFLKEASNLFEMYINTMGTRPYALEISKLLDPNDIYFNSRIIAQNDSKTRYQKDLDIVLGKESAVLILDDSETVWSNHMENLILIERYHFFAQSCGNRESLSQRRRDETETEGTLATILKILQQIHSLFFDPASLLERKDNLVDRDVRQVLKTLRKEVLKGCRIVFSGVFGRNFPPNQRLWGMAEQLGATCSMKIDPCVTHVVSLDAGTNTSQWAVLENKFLVLPEWIEASNYLWRKQPEEKFPVSRQAN